MRETWKRWQLATARYAEQRRRCIRRYNPARDGMFGGGAFMTIAIWAMRVMLWPFMAWVVLYSATESDQFVL